MDYASYQTSLATLMATTVADTYFQTILPDCINYAELRIYRELDILNTRYRDQSQATNAGSRLISLPSTVIVAETVAVLTPSLPQITDTANANVLDTSLLGVDGAQTGATRNVLTPVTHDWIDLIYPNDGPSEYQSMPLYYAMVTQTTALVGPSPDAGYIIETTGIFRPASLSATNTTTPLTALLPDLFLAASMIFMAGYQKNYGAQADDPKMSSSWEAQYQNLMMGAKSEEFRKKLESSSWTAMIQSPVADKQRG